MLQQIVLVDAFTATAFSGNPAGVCVMEAFPEGGRMQAVALEMNQAETAFAVPMEEGFRLRWFTPRGEVDLCGHATLALAHHLWESGTVVRGEAIRFETLSGSLTARGEAGWIELNFPTEVVREVVPPFPMAPMLGATPVFVGRNRLDFVLELESEEEVRGLAPDLRQVAELPCRGLIVTAAGRGEADFVSRCFFPRFGVNEDPVTGSAHCGLSSYWSGRFGGREMLAYQASPRGGWLRVRLAGERTFLYGKAVTTMRGEMIL